MSFNRRPPICPDCGDQCEAYSHKSGYTLYMCSHIKGTIVKDRVGRVDNVVVTCNTPDVLGSPAKAFKKLGKDKLKVADLVVATNHEMSPGQLVTEANSAMQLGVPAEKLPALFRSMLILGRTKGRDTVRSIRDGVYGIVHESWRRLDNIGVKLRKRQAMRMFPKLKPDEAWVAAATKLIIEGADLVT